MHIIACSETCHILLFSTDILKMNSEVERMSEGAIRSLIEEWRAYNKNGQFEGYLSLLLDTGDWKKLSKYFGQRLKFGTAGLRARMGPGFNCLNDVVILQTTRGLLEYLKETIIDFNQKGVVIGYDGRHCSREFAHRAACVFLDGGVKVHLFSRMNPTPYVPFAVLKLGACCGIMVTASHNPKEDNGYKVYGENGAQIISPADEMIEQAISRDLTIKDSWWKPLPHSPLLSDPLEGIIKEYRQFLAVSTFDLTLNTASYARFVYTAMHGVGYNYIKDAFEACHLAPVVPTTEQIDPDPDFPTVKFPNPEEGKSALDLAIATAESVGINMILANDPDADRLAVAEKTQGAWKIFTGNEIGALLGWWLIKVFEEKGGNSAEAYVLSSTVSSRILETMASKRGIHFEETLTGFKWMGNRTQQLVAEGKKVIFAFEEAIGFMCGGAELPDKDGIMAAIKIAELTAWMQKNACGSLNDLLTEIYREYGWHLCDNSYFFCDDPVVISNIFQRLRNYNGQGGYPKRVGEFWVKGVRDLTVGWDSRSEDGKPSLPSSTSSQMITFYFEDFVLTLRTSGTEPKVKYYSELRGVGDEEDLRNKLKEMVRMMVTDFLQPQVNRLKAKAE